MRKLFLCLLVAVTSAAVYAAGTQEKEGDSVVVYAALDEKTANDLCAAFEAKTGIKAELALQVEQAGSITGRIKTEANAPRADVFIGGNSNYHTDLANNNLLEAYRSPIIEEVGISSDFMDATNYWTGWYLGALCIIYNTERYEKEISPLGIEPPLKWNDLLNPIYEGEVIASNPATTGGAFLMMAAQIFRLGSEDKGFEFIEQLHPNVAQYTKGGNGSIPLVSQGEAIVGFSWGHDTLKQQIQGDLPITIVFPEDTGFEIGAASIIKGASNLENAQKFIDFLLSAEAGKINATNGYRYPVRTGVELPQGVPAFETLNFAEWDLEMAAFNTDAWKKKWASITGK
ncbi:MULTISPECIES: ABC transporter substrate-binding protein [unclassified Oceanispirochaeta]|uniref:ABC transporter substrate-binding protein n=1 Tax=unclassified Oceanispirochaeta TaxID=2635722 RepID=UPI0013148020|nr:MULTISPECIES: ABC transporter substrate-binding protein [unclassified Oceanispirochaeta]MBF9018651.1 ABC transporter substrate-binding protein [Oceanispirochaeta sp. M2]NPD75088.1 ABC transporter substrate-binding protein [Oceanispirochaeta sp. M1]